MPTTRVRAEGAAPAPRGGVAGHGIGRGHEGIGAVVDIQMRALRAFKEDVAALALHFLQTGLHICEVRDEARGQASSSSATAAGSRGSNL